MKRIELTVKGMTCPSCEMIIKEELEDTKGVETVSANQKEERVEVEFDEQSVSVDKISQVITGLGYTVK